MVNGPYDYDKVTEFFSEHEQYDALRRDVMDIYREREEKKANEQIT